MRFDSHKLTTICLLALIPICAGCGGGGGSSDSGGGVNPPAPVLPLALTVAAPSVAGKVGQDVLIPVSVTGPGSVNTASLDIRVDPAAFEPAGAYTGTAQEITDLPASAAACYKWIDSRTIRVLFVSADGIATGNVLVNVPARVKAETAGATSLTNVILNQ